MDDAAPPAPTAPRSGLLRAIGVLNVLFGGMLLVVGSVVLNVTSSWVLGTTPLRVDPEIAQAFFDDLRRQRIEDLRAQERSAGDEAERARIAKERAEVEASRPRVGREIDFARVEADLAWLLRYLRYDFVSGPILDALLVVSGVGLVLGKGWGRRLALATASLKLVRLVALGALLMAVVLPRVGATLDLLLETEMGRSIIAQAVERQARQGGISAGPPPTPREVVQLFRGLATVSAIAFVSFGAIYPLAVLVLLGRGRARAVRDTPVVA